MKKNIIIFATLTVLIFICFSPALNAPFIYDSKINIAENQQIKSLNNLWEDLFIPKTTDRNLFKYVNDPARPLTYLTFHLNYYVDKYNPTGYRLFNMGLLLILGYLMYLFLFNILCTIYPITHSHWGAFVSSILFLLHPLNFHTTTYVYHRSEILSFIFYLTSLLFYHQNFKNKNPLFICFSLISFILGLLSKQILLLLPFVILVFDYTFCSNYSFKKLWENKSKWLSFFIIFLIYNLYRNIHLRTEFLFHPNTTMTDTLFYFLHQPKNIILYIIKTIIPYNLLIMHFPKEIKNIADINFLIPVSLLCTIFFISLDILKKAKTNPRCRLYFFGIFFFFINILPTSSFFIASELMADRRVYIPMLGIIIISNTLLIKLVLEKTILKKIIAVILLLLTITYTYKTISKNFKINHPEKIWEEVSNTYPNQSLPNVHLGISYANKKQFEKAKTLFNKALEITPDSTYALYNLAVLHYQLKDYNKALSYSLQATQLKKYNPKSKMLTADIYADLNQIEKSLLIYQELLNKYPDMPTIKVKIVRLLITLKKHEAALGLINELLKDWPDDTEYICIKSSLLIKLNDIQNARNGYLKVLKHDPINIDALHGLGMIYFQEKDYKNTKKTYLKLINIDKEQPLFYNNLGSVFLAEGRSIEAIKYFKKAIEVNKFYLSAYLNLCNLYLDINKKKEARTLIEQYIKLDPTNIKAKNLLKSMSETNNE